MCENRRVMLASGASIDSVWGQHKEFELGSHHESVTQLGRGTK